MVVSGSRLGGSRGGVDREDGYSGRVVGSLRGVVLKAGRGVTAWAGVGKEFQLWIGKSGGGGTKGYAE